MTLETASQNPQETVIALMKEVSLLRQSNSYLEEQLPWFKRQIFGPRSEKTIKTVDQPKLFEEGFGLSPKPKAEEKQPQPAPERKKPNRDGKDTIKLPSDLPVERQVIDISEEEKICPETGKPLVKIGEEVTLKLAHRPGIMSRLMSHNAQKLEELLPDRWLASRAAL